jgi:hypothetical protein
MADDQAPNIPPYVAYSTLTTFLNSMRDELPERIDRSVMRNLSGTQQSAIIGALRFLDLVEQSGKPTPALRELVDADEKHFPAHLKTLLEKHYAFLSAGGLNLERASGAQVAERFREAGMTGSTIAKAMQFYIAAAKAAGIKLSSHIKPPAVPKSATPRRARNGGRADDALDDEIRPPAPRSAVKTFHELLLEKFPEFNPDWEPEVQKKWFAAFDELMKHGKKDGATG